MILFTKSTSTAAPGSFPVGATSADAVLAMATQMTDSEKLQLYRDLRTLLKNTHVLTTDIDNLYNVSVRLSSVAWHRIQHLAQVKHTSLSEELRYAVDSYCDTYG